MSRRAQSVDPTVSRTKFDREIREYRGMEAEYRRRGWFLVRAEFPHVLVVLTAPRLKPPAIITGVRFDYTNYDAEPPSVRLVNPFTDEPYRARELPTQLERAIQGDEISMPGLPGNLRLKAAQPLMQAYGPEEIPFLCLAGVREYHEHPAHSGDAWELHRIIGAGRLLRLLNVIHQYGVEPIKGYGVNLVPQITFDVPDVPA